MDGHLTRWSRADLDAVLLELFPAKMIVDDDDLDDVVPDTAAFVDFLAGTGLLDPASDDPQVLRAHLETLPERFRRRMADASRYSPGKRFWLAATAAGVPLDDQAAVSAFIEQFNARPLPERDLGIDLHRHRSEHRPCDSSAGRAAASGPHALPDASGCDWNTDNEKKGSQREPFFRVHFPRHKHPSPGHNNISASGPPSGCGQNI